MFIGKCLRCGACCKEGERFHYYGTGEKITRVEVKEKDPDIQPCSALRFGADGKAFCSTHETKSIMCAGWPHFKEELIFPSCGYRWIDDTLPEEGKPGRDRER